MRNQRKAQVRESRGHETRISTLVAGKRLPASGALSWGTFAKGVTACGDITSPTFHIEHKYTIQDELRVRRDWLLKVTEGAKRASKHPALILSYSSPTRIGVRKDTSVPSVDKLLLSLQTAKQVSTSLAAPWNRFSEVIQKVAGEDIPPTRVSVAVPKSAGVSVVRFHLRYEDNSTSVLEWCLLPLEPWLPALRGEEA